MERAAFLLRETDRSVTEICLDVGFTSLGTFSRTFSAILGESPTAYRRRAVSRAVLLCRLDSTEQRASARGPSSFRRSAPAFGEAEPASAD